jgi:hypothetical protein
MRLKVGTVWAMALGVLLAGCNKSDPTDPTIPAKMVMVDGQPQTGAAGAVAVAPLRVRVLNQAGDPVAGVAVTWAVTSGGGSLSQTTTQTSAEGIAAVTFTYGDAGEQTITATIPGLSGSPQTFTLTATTPGGGGGGNL